MATGSAIALQSNTLRTGGVISANTISATSSQVYGKVEATSATGSTYNSGTTIVTTAKRPTMPDWTSVFNYYRTNGTQIDINSLPMQTPNLASNPGFENGTTDWTGQPTGISAASISNKNNPVHSGSSMLRVKNRTDWSSAPHSTLMLTSNRISGTP